jgi:hypothetical protein
MSPVGFEFVAHTPMARTARVYAWQVCDNPCYQPMQSVRWIVFWCQRQSEPYYMRRGVRPPESFEE